VGQVSGTCICVSTIIAKNASVQKMKKQKPNFAGLYLGIGWSDLLQIWYVDLLASL